MARVVSRVDSWEPAANAYLAIIICLLRSEHAQGVADVLQQLSFDDIADVNHPYPRGNTGYQRQMETALENVQALAQNHD